MQSWDVMIVGAGAAGLLCAKIAGSRGKKVLLLEHNDRIGKKVLISGGGRCNFTNLYAKPENFISENPHFCKSALARFTPEDFLKLLEKHKIPYFEKKLGQLFCKNSAKEITQMLLKECEEAGVKIILNCKTQQLCHPQLDRGSNASKLDSRFRGNDKPGFFQLQTNQGTFSSPTLIIATGGLSYQNLGATPFAYQIAEQFGIQVIPPRPGLVPLLWNAEDLKTFSGLSGVSIDAKVSCKKVSFRENILFTHRGLSGPAILQISSYWKKDEIISLNLFPEMNLAAYLLQEKSLGNKSEIKNLLSQFVSKSFLEIWCKKYFPSRPLLQISDKELHPLAQLLQNWEITPAGDEGYEKAEVTLGGIDTRELSSQNMESKKIAGLYFIGECIDVTGHLGGFNFQWAWASAHAAAMSL